MPMNPRLLRPRASGVHPEAAAWRTAVVANGGTVSGSTLSAVDKFCKAIDAAGIRDRFYRLNLFCGTGLNACLVPLYRGPSRSGTQYGNTTDTNNGPFVSGDYVETGASGGLLGNGSNKTLNTGLPGNTVAFGSLHLSAYVVTAPTVGTYRPAVVARSSANADEAGLYSNQTPHTSPPYFAEENTATGHVAATTNNPTGLIMGSSVSATDRRFYLNGMQNGSTVTTALTRTQYPSDTFRVFFAQVANTYFNGRMAGYSIGSGMTSSQALAYYTAMQTFQAALSRNV